MNSPLKMLLAEPDEAQRLARRAYLQAAGYVVDEAATLAAARLCLAHTAYHFVLLAQTQPDGDGLTLLAEADQHTSEATSFILFTATSAVEERISGFAAGADECLPPDVELPELASRLRCIARQRFSQPQPRLSFGTGFVLNPPARRLQHGPHEVPLSRSQFDLLHLLVQHRGQPLTRKQLGAHIGKNRDFSNAIDVQIGNVRRTLASYAPADFLQTVRGVGYLVA
ncbi:MAG: response regulator transcription factor [Bacteroidota bacterium]|nr:response regulator transcription factor [Bacteroidota bacterium]